MMRKFTIALAAFCICGSCISETDKIEKITLSPEKQISSFSNNIFFSTILDIEDDGENLYFLEYPNYSIFKTDAALHLVSELSLGGKGPNKIEYCPSITFHKGTLFAIDQAKGRVAAYSSSGEFLFDFKQVYFSTYVTDMTASGNMLLLGSPDEEKPIQRIDLNKLEKQQGFGLRTKWESKQETRNNNVFSLESYKDRIVAVNLCQPEIYLYEAASLDVAKKFNIAHKVINNRLRYIQKKKKQAPSQNTFYTLFSDIQVFGDFLYLLADSNGPNGEYMVKDILKVDLRSGLIRSHITFSLQEDPALRSFRILNDRIIGYDAVTGNLLIFKY